MLFGAISHPKLILISEFIPCTTPGTKPQIKQIILITKFLSAPDQINTANGEKMQHNNARKNSEAPQHLFDLV